MSINPSAHFVSMASFPINRHYHWSDSIKAPPGSSLHPLSILTPLKNKRRATARFCYQPSKFPLPSDLSFALSSTFFHLPTHHLSRHGQALRKGSQVVLFTNTIALRFIWIDADVAYKIVADVCRMRHTGQAQMYRDALIVDVNLIETGQTKFCRRAPTMSSTTNGAPRPNLKSRVSLFAPANDSHSPHRFRIRCDHHPLNPLFQVSRRDFPWPDDSDCEVSDSTLT